MTVIDFLKQAKVAYEVLEHPAAFTAQQVAAVEHEPGRFVAKAVIVKADGEPVMCVVAAPRKVDLEKVRAHLGAGKVELAEEAELGRLFPDCELGAEPPIGRMYGVRTLIDRSLESADHVVFAAGSHEKAVRMAMPDYRRVVEGEAANVSV